MFAYAYLIDTFNKTNGKIKGKLRSGKEKAKNNMKNVDSQ